ncbi:DUF1183-domain-containing protein [Thelephora ganbajun]|uniref:DUF1183-domain-containing protein n=1 Tax=Thelephora ganbajun TaxID=370292 RepID=A0ACB6Z200_THEGA|nr:DUF1183-domain-containing protein [Thelephora ganbajun]
MSRIRLQDIPVLTFYKGALTAARRADAIPQLTCIGKACRLYQPEAIRCTNAGGFGNNVDWKCEVDLPSALRLGQVRVSCEGWSKPGDSHVLQGSCGLEYRLVEVPKTLRDDYAGTSSWTTLLNPDKFLSTIFSTLWIALLIFVAYNFIRSRRPPTGNAGTGPRPWGPGFGGGSGWFSGRDHRRRSPSPPPPYSKDGPSSSRTGGQGGGPGFWTGVAAGGLGSYLYNRVTQPRTQPQPATWDWERPEVARSSGWFGQPQSQPAFTPRWGSTSRFDDNRGEGSSNLGSMRTSTGFGGSHVRFCEVMRDSTRKAYSDSNGASEKPFSLLGRSPFFDPSTFNYE